MMLRVPPAVGFCGFMTVILRVSLAATGHAKLAPAAGEIVSGLKSLSGDTVAPLYKSVTPVGRFAMMEMLVSVQSAMYTWHAAPPLVSQAYASGSGQVLPARREGTRMAMS